MAKTNWSLHIEQYRALQSSEGITVREYAERNGLNPNTARRALSGVSDQSEKQSDQKPKKPQKSPLDEPVRTSRTGRSKKIDELGIKEAPKRAGKRAAPTPEQEKVPDSKNAKKITSKSDQKVAREKKPRGKGKPFKAGHEVSKKLGVYGTPRQEDIDKAVELLSKGVDAAFSSTLLSSLATANYAMRSIDEAISAIDEEIEAFENMGSGGGVDGEDDRAYMPHPSFKKAKLLMDATYLADSHTQAIHAMNMVSEKMAIEKRKVAIAERKQSVADITAKVIREAMKLRDEQGWSDVETAEYIEAFGVKVPTTLMARAAKEIANMQPEANDDGAVDDAELDRAAREYAANKLNAPSFVESRRQAIAELTDTLGLGDHSTDGQRRSGEIEQSEDELDIDYDLAREMYGEDFDKHFPNAPKQSSEGDL